ncbi:MAG: hypothetical protein ABFD49_11485 [Armatimonadota bacterium]|nr:hypothetical protein [bacterium]
MIINESGSRIISNFGWVDKGSLWVCDTDSCQPYLIEIDSSDYIEIISGSADLFAVVHHDNAGQFKVSARSFADPELALSQIVVKPGETNFVGSADTWIHLPKVYASYYSPLEDYCLFVIDSALRKVDYYKLALFSTGPDKAYHGIISATEVPKSSRVVISVQRDSLILHDIVRKKSVRSISLADRNGNPKVLFRRNGEEMWATDYDYLLRLDINGWKIRNMVRLQESSSEFERSFIGNFAFSRNEQQCVVARPFSHDVVALDTDRFTVTHRAPMEMQPLAVVVLDDGKVFARDWYTGSLLKSVLVPVTNIG